jgi:hypothetical protein
VSPVLAREAGDLLWGPLAARSAELLGGLSDDDLRTLIDVLEKGTEMQLERAAALRAELDGGQDSTTR